MSALKCVSAGDRKRFFFALVALLMISIFASGCGRASSSSVLPPSPDGYTVTDVRGDIVYIPNRPKRILTANLTLDTIVVGLVPPENLAAACFYDYDPMMSSIAAETKDIRPRLRTLPNVPIETVVKIKPDLVIASTFVAREYIDMLKEIGCPVLICKGVETIADTKDTIRLIAKALQAEKEGERIIAEMDRQLAEIDETLAKRTDDPPVAMLISTMRSYGGPGSMYHELLTRARIVNGIERAGIKNHQELSKERIIKARPDFFILSSPRISDPGRAQKTQLQFIDDPALLAIPASRRVYHLPDRYIYAAGQNLVYGIKAMANLAYGDIFDMSDEHLIKGY